MIHLVFNRPSGHLKIYDSDSTLWDTIEAAGDAWGSGSDLPYGHDCPMPPGHYRLQNCEPIAPPIRSEGGGQIAVTDLDPVTLTELTNAGHVIMSGEGCTIGGILAPLGGMAKYARAAIMIHGGGSNAPDPFAPFQVLCKTEGCTRVHNADLTRLMRFFSDRASSNTFIYTAVGDPIHLAQ